MDIYQKENPPFLREEGNIDAKDNNSELDVENGITCDQSDHDSEDECVEIDSLMRSRTIEDTAKSLGITCDQSDHDSEDECVEIDSLMRSRTIEDTAKSFGITCDQSDHDSEDECVEIDSLMRSRTIEDTAKSLGKRKQKIDIDDALGEDDDENLDETTEIDGKVVVEVDLAEDAEAESRPTNTYAAKKTVAQGMMDIALLTANANQLRYAMELRNSIVVGLIVFSLVLQVSIGIAMIFKGRMYLRGKSKDPITSRIDTFIVSGIFLITVINIFIASFTTTTGDTVKN